MSRSAQFLDQVDYQEILSHALARIQVHNPEWTNFNDSDPGVTLLQLFAFMMESVAYRAEQIPERNHKKFLGLLGIPRLPAQAATGFVTFHNTRGPLQAITLESDLEVLAGAVPFRTVAGIEVLPIEVRTFYKHSLPTSNLSSNEQAERERYRLLYADMFEEDSSEPAFYETRPLPQPSPDGVLPVLDLVQDTVDGCLWLALLARPASEIEIAVEDARTAIAGKHLTIGVMPGMDTEGLWFQHGQRSFSVPPDNHQSTEGPAAHNNQATDSSLVWEIANPGWGKQPAYRELRTETAADILSQPGLVHLKLPGGPGPTMWDTLEPSEEGTRDYPPSLVDTNLGPRVITWIRLRVRDVNSTPRALISWLGANATMVVQRTRVINEVIGAGNGQPDQQFTLTHTPVIPGDELTLTVGDESENWERIDDLLAADPEVRIEDPRLPAYMPLNADSARVDKAPALKRYQLDPQAGTITFGDGAHGMRPRSGERIIASYAYGGGRQGNVNIGAVNRSPDLPSGLTVTNPIRTWGGADEESTESAERRIPATLRHRDRLVSVKDFEDITLRTPGVDLGRVEVLPLYDPQLDKSDIPGVVTLIVIPKHALISPDAPQPDHLTLDAICRYLEPRRLVTTDLHVRGPQYKDIWISVGIQVISGYSPGLVRENVSLELKKFLSPLKGGPNEDGWPLGQWVLRAELEAVATRVKGVHFVNELYVDTTTETPSGVALASSNGTESVKLEAMELPRLVGLSVTLGAALLLDDLWQAPSITDPDTPLTPIPLIPCKC